MHPPLPCPGREVRQSMPFGEKDCVTQLHGWWHVLTGLGTYLHIMSSSRIRMEILGYNTAVKVTYVCVYVRVCVHVCACVIYAPPLSLYLPVSSLQTCLGLPYLTVQRRLMV